MIPQILKDVALDSESTNKMLFHWQSGKSMYSEYFAVFRYIYKYM